MPDYAKAHNSPSVLVHYGSMSTPAGLDKLREFLEPSRRILQ
jgi:hypothetical protein